MDEIKKQLREYFLPLVAEKHIVRIKEKKLFEQFNIPYSMNAQAEILTAFKNMIETAFDIRKMEYIFYDDKSKYYLQEKKRLQAIKSIYSKS